MITGGMLLSLLQACLAGEIAANQPTFFFLWSSDFKPDRWLCSDHFRAHHAQRLGYSFLFYSVNDWRAL